MNKRQQGYFAAIGTAFRTLKKGLQLTWQHTLEARKSKAPIGVEHPDYFQVQKGIITLQYPHVQIPVPEVGRYKLHNEIDDCIVCDKCAKVCPVNCIEIEPIRATEEFGKTSDGTSKRIYAAKFEIDMAKCCFCGLCTTVCPTECLTMTPEYDFSTFHLAEHQFEFADMTPLEILERKKEWEAYQAQKNKDKELAASGSTETPKASAPKPVIKPKMPIIKPKPQEGDGT